nr:hypothetical protein [Mesorhizobium sp.]
MVDAGDRQDPLRANRGWLNCDPAPRRNADLSHRVGLFCHEVRESDYIRPQIRELQGNEQRGGVDARAVAYSEGPAGKFGAQLMALSGESNIEGSV